LLNSTSSLESQNVLAAREISTYSFENLPLADTDLSSGPNSWYRDKILWMPEDCTSMVFPQSAEKSKLRSVDCLIKNR